MNMEIGFAKNWVGLVNMVFDFEIIFIEKRSKILEWQKYDPKTNGSKIIISWILVLCDLFSTLKVRQKKSKHDIPLWLQGLFKMKEWVEQGKLKYMYFTPLKASLSLDYYSQYLLLWIPSLGSLIEETSLPCCQPSILDIWIEWDHTKDLFHIQAKIQEYYFKIWTRWWFKVCRGKWIKKLGVKTWIPILKKIKM